MSEENTIKNEEIKETSTEVVEEEGKKKKKQLDVYNIVLLVVDYIFIIASYVTALMLISELNDEYCCNGYTFLCIILQYSIFCI